MSAVSGIVLAGGRSRRFGSDKLAARLDGVAILDRAVAALTVVCDEVLVVVPPEGRPDVPIGAIAVADPEPFAGPLVGLLAGLEAARAPVALVVGGDMPWLAPDVLRLLADEAAGAAGGVHQLESATGSGVGERLPFAVRTDRGRATARALVDRGERRLAAFAVELGGALVPAARWVALDRGARTPGDVDLPGDLRDGD